MILVILSILLIFAIIFYLSDRVIPRLFSGTIAVIACLGILFCWFGPGINLSPLSQTETSTAKNSSYNDIRKQLVRLTDRSSPGSNRNYYYILGKAQFSSFSRLKHPGVLNNFDAMGRPWTAKAKLTRDMYFASSGSRQGTPLNPPNLCWPKNRRAAIHFSLTNRTYHGYFYNRSHSVADSLAGSASYHSAANFTAGTRSQNVGANQKGGMRAPERYVEKYWMTHNNPGVIVKYEVTPVYNNLERIPRGSIVDVQSSDHILNKRFVIINDAEGYNINYMFGKFKKN